MLGEEKEGERDGGRISLHGGGQGGGSNNDSDRAVDESWDRRDMVGCAWSRVICVRRAKWCSRARQPGSDWTAGRKRLAGT